MTPYENNPRRNDEAVRYVYNSIKNFGFKVPIVIDKNNVVVCGHTRLKAAKKLKLKKVPCVIASDLTEDQIRAFRIADNKVSEKATWQSTLLQHEIKGLPKYNFTDFGFDFNIVGVDTNNEKKENQRNKTVRGYNLDYYCEDFAKNKWGMPELTKIDYIPKDMVGFNYAKTEEDTSKTIHFYVDDYQFERVWNNPDKYIKILKKFDCVLTPDFSLYTDMPLAMQIWNIYRSRMFGQICEVNGIRVIPTISWCREDSFNFCFDGIPKNSTVSISTIGIKKDDKRFELWKNGVDEMIRRLDPIRILVYGGKVNYDFGDIEVIYYENKVTKKWGEKGKEENNES